MLRFFYLFLPFFWFFCFSVGHSLESEWGGIEEAKVRIISPFSKANDNDIFYIGLEYQLKEDWKTYWKSPGEGGFPQQIDWSQSTNIANLEILWPIPEEFEILGFKSIGYTDEVIFPLKVKLLDLKLPTNFIIDLNFLTCKDICLPGQATLNLFLPPGKGNLTNHSFKLEKYLSKIPLDNNTINGLEILNASAFSDNQSTLIKIQAKSNTFFNKPKLYLDTALGLPVISPKYIYSANRTIIDATFVYDRSLFIEDVFDISILLKDGNSSIIYNSSIDQRNTSNLIFFLNQSYLYIFLLAFFGGFILNFMPCVLPVLSIKLLSVLENSQTSLFAIRKSFFLTSIGIIFSFLSLALIFIGLKISGTSISWGMQFQQPLFLMIIALILFLFSLNLFGIFDFTLPSKINDYLNIAFFNKKHSKDFFNGIFATILATPCSAPFVGTAITVAFTQSYIIMLGIFAFMGVGMAIPFLLASIFPQSIKLLPKPGNWMNTIKFILGFFLIVTLVWIGIILNNHFNYNFFIISVFLFLLIIISFKYFKKVKLLVVLFSICIFFLLNFFPIFDKDLLSVETEWLDLTKVDVKKLIIENNIVFVDITADWCVTCQFNKINIINSEIIQNAFQENKIIKVKGDWTKTNKIIEEYLNSYNRFGVPFNVMYGQSYPDGIILSEILTTKEIISTVKKLKQKN